MGALENQSQRAMLEQLLLGVKGEKLRRKAPKQEAAETTDFAPKSDIQGVDLMLMKEENRRMVRAAVENQPPLLRFLIEMAPATIGTGFGSLLGLPGAIAGGVGGELAGQEFGLTPRSNLGIGLAAGGPLLGRTAGVIKKGFAKIAGQGIKAVVPVRVAIARNIMKKAVDEFESLGTAIIAKQRGFMAVAPSKLFSIAERANVRIPAFRTYKTRQAFNVIRKDIRKTGLDQLPEGRRVLKLIDSLEEAFKGSTIGFAELVNARTLVGSAVKQASRAGGQKLGSTKLFFKAIVDDMDHLASLGGKTGAKGKIAKAAFERTKLDFAIKDLQEEVAKSISGIAGKIGRTLNVRKLRNRIDDLTNIQHPSYNKKMTEALEDELPGIKKRLIELSEFADSSPAGPGSLVVRTIGAGVGGTIGQSVAGNVGAVAGGLIGVRIPEMMVAILSSDNAVRFLKRAITLGDGTISKKAWDTAGQIAAQGAKFDEQNSGQSPLSGVQ